MLSAELVAEMSPAAPSIAANAQRLRATELASVIYVSSSARVGIEPNFQVITMDRTRPL